MKCKNSQVIETSFDIWLEINNLNVFGRNGEIVRMHKNKGWALSRQLQNCASKHHTIQDAEFLVTNKFAYIVNCSAEVINFYEGQGLKYLKFKLIRDKPHKLWDESLKKLKKLDKFIQNCQQNSMCCLIHSYDGINRGLVMLVAFLMNRYRWKLGKTLQFVRSKQIFIGLSQHYIQQLQKLQIILSQSQPSLTSDWKIEYRSTEQQIISKTFMNSQQIDFKQSTKRQKKNKRVVWKDMIEKQKKKQQKQLIKQQQRQRGIKILGTNEDQKNVIDLSLKNENKKKLKGQSQGRKQLTGGLKKVKVSGNRSKPEILLRQSEHVDSKSAEKYKQKIEEQEQQNIDEDQIINLIKKNLKSKKKIDAECVQVNNENQQKIYNVTINNFIKPNINILNKASAIGQKKKTKKRPQSAWRKSKPL